MKFKHRKGYKENRSLLSGVSAASFLIQAYFEFDTNNIFQTDMLPLLLYDINICVQKELA